MIDSADMIKKGAEYGPGNSGKALAVACRVREAEDSGELPRGHCRVLLDRDWTALASDIHSRAITRHASEHDRLCYLTKGHSIENYLLTGDWSHHELKMCFPDLVTEETAEAWKLASEAATELAFAFSWAMCESMIANRMGALPRVEDIAIDSGGRFVLQETLAKEMTRRGVDGAVTWVSNVNKRNGIPLYATLDEARLLAHGKIALMVTRTCLAVVLRGYGVDGGLCDQVASGRQDERWRSAFAWLAAQDPDLTHPLRELAELAIGATPPTDTMLS